MSLGTPVSLGGTISPAANVNTVTHLFTSAVPADSTVVFGMASNGSVRGIVSAIDSAGNKYGITVVEVGANNWAGFFYTAAGIAASTTLTITFGNTANVARLLEANYIPGRAVLDRAREAHGSGTAWSVAIADPTTASGCVSIAFAHRFAATSNSNQSGSSPAHTELSDRNGSVNTICSTYATGIGSGVTVTAAGTWAASGTWTAFVLVFREYVGSYDDVVAGLGPFRYLKLDESSGSVAEDVIQGGDGAYVNPPTFGAAGLVNDGGDSVSMDAASSEELTVPITISTQQMFSIACWFEWATGIAVARDDTTTLGTIVAFDDSGTVKFRIAGTDTTPSTTLAALQDSNRHLVVLVRESGNVAKLYIDGNLVGTGTAGTGALTSPLHFGRNGTNADYSDAIFDNIAIFMHSLTAAQVLEMYDAALLIDPPTSRMVIVG